MTINPNAYIILTIEEIQRLTATKNGAAMSVYLGIKSFCFRGKRNCYPTRRAIAQRLGGSYGVRTITTAIRKLVEVGLIERVWDAMTNIWKCKLALEVPKTGRRKRSGGGKVQPTGRSTSKKINKKLNIEEDAVNQVIEEIYQAKNTNEWRSANAEAAKTLGVKERNIPRPPRWMTREALENWLRMRIGEEGAIDDTWLMRWFEGRHIQKIKASLHGPYTGDEKLRMPLET